MWVSALKIVPRCPSAHPTLSSHHAPRRAHIVVYARVIIWDPLLADNVPRSPVCGLNNIYPRKWYIMCYITGRLFMKCIGKVYRGFTMSMTKSGASYSFRITMVLPKMLRNHFSLVLCYCLWAYVFIVFIILQCHDNSIIIGQCNVLNGISGAQ